MPALGLASSAQASGSGHGALPWAPKALQLGVYEDAVRALREGVVVVDDLGKILAINPSAEGLLGMDRADWRSVSDPNTNWSLSYPDGETCPVEQWPLQRCLSGHQMRGETLGLRRPDGSQIWLSISTMPLVRSRETLPYGAVAYFYEQSPCHEQSPASGQFPCSGPSLSGPPASAGEQGERAEPSHDALTGLSNRAHFRDRLTQALTVPGARFALCCLELNHFKLVNSEFGHSAGDALLIEVADRLRAHITQATELARFGGDEFMLLWPDIVTQEEVEACERALQDLFSVPFQVGEHEVFLGVSVGIGLYPGNDTSDTYSIDADTLLGRVESAVWHAQTSGRQAAENSPALLSARLSERWLLEGELRRALTHQQLGVVYQPVIGAVSGQTVAAEALVRWNHPSLGEISPSRFIPVAEDSGLIHLLGAWVLRQSCRDASGWPPEIRVAVNVSALQFERPDFLAGVEAALQQSGLSPARLELELTESAVTRDPALTSAHIQRLRALGVRVTLDDFGTGYSNLSVLRHLSLSALKMDQSFVVDLEHDPRQQPLIRAIVQLGHALNLEVVAEGVESSAQREILTALGCDLLQGYGVARPSSAPALATWLTAADRD